MMSGIGLPISDLQRAAPIIGGFLLGYVVVLPLLGRISDLYGRAPVMVACLAAFAAGSLLTATAEGLPMAVAGRTVQGLGGGGLVPVTLALVADLWPAGHRGVPLGVVGAVQEIGSVLGPLYGAAIVALSGWRAIFWINLALAAALCAVFALGARSRSVPGAGSDTGRPDVVGAVLALLATAAGVLALTAPPVIAESDTLGVLYGPLAGAAITTPVSLAALGLLAALAAWEAAAPESLARRLARRGGSAPVRLDWVGALLLGGALACVIVAFAAADPSRQIAADNAVVTLPLAAVLCGLFAWRERRAAHPLVPLSAFRDRAAAGSLLVNLLVGSALMAALVDIPIFARTTEFPDSQVQASLILVRFLVAVPLGALLGGLVCERASYRATAGAGMALSAVMFGLMSGWGAAALGTPARLAGVRLPLNASDAVLFLCGLGFGVAIAPVNAAVLAAVRASLHGLASSMAVVARMVGMLAGLSVLTAIGLNRFYAAQAHVPSPLRLCPTTPANCTRYNDLAKLAILDELHAIFVGATVCAGGAAVLAAAMLRRSAAAPPPRLSETLAAASGAGG